MGDSDSSRPSLLDAYGDRPLYADVHYLRKVLNDFRERTSKTLEQRVIARFTCMGCPKDYLRDIIVSPDFFICEVVTKLEPDYPLL